MEKRIFVVANEIVQGVVSASDYNELETKLKTLFDGIREPIEGFSLPEFNDFNDMESHEFTVHYIDDEEEFSIQRVNIV
jgi:hypothetical protein